VPLPPAAAVVLLGTAAAVHLVSAVRRRAPPTWATPPADMRPAAWAAMLVGVALTTFSAPTLSTWALFRVPTFAVWNGLSALGPMWAVPLGWCLKREAISVRTAGGAAMAATGAALLGVVR
jgi:drug/metabolite transporter (DMT)-like permease